MNKDWLDKLFRHPIISPLVVTGIIGILSAIDIFNVFDVSGWLASVAVGFSSFFVAVIPVSGWMLIVLISGPLVVIAFGSWYHSYFSNVSYYTEDVIDGIWFQWSDDEYTSPSDFEAKCPKCLRVMAYDVGTSPVCFTCIHLSCRFTMILKGFSGLDNYLNIEVQQRIDNGSYRKAQKRISRYKTRAKKAK